jgi:hypothetical protein
LRKAQKATAPWVPPHPPPPPARYDPLKPPPLEPIDDNPNPAHPQVVSALHAVREIVDSVGASIRSWKKDSDDDHLKLTIFVAYRIFQDFFDRDTTFPVHLRIMQGNNYDCDGQ